MSQMPDKIWLHKDTKYNTEDVVSAYQYEFAQEIECEGIENFVEYVPAGAFIEKACKTFCKVRCNGKPPRDTCTSLGTCDEYDDFCKTIKKELL